MNKKLSFAVIACISLLLASCGSKNKNQEQDNLPDYEIVTLAPQSRTINYSYPAILKGINDVDIFPQVQGRIVSQNYTDGGLVRKGQVLFTIDPTTARLEVQTAEGNLKAAQAALSTAKLEYDSQKNLFDKHIVSSYVMERAQNAYLTAQAQVAQAKAGLSIAKTNLSHCTIVSPVTGIIRGRLDRLSTLVSPGMAEPMATVSEQSTIEASFALNEALYLRIFEKGDVANTAQGLQPANESTAVDETLSNISLKLKDGTVYPEKGKFRNVGGMVDSSTGSVTCKVLFPNPNNILHSGNTATIVFPHSVKDAIIVPQTACKKLQDKYLIYRVNAQGIAEGVVIDVMSTDDGKEFIVFDGLKEGDRIVANGVARIQEGQKVAK